MKIFSIEKAQEKAALEKIIDVGLSGFMDVAGALTVIKQKGLYKDEFNTFDQYCTQKWHMTKQHVYRKIKAFDVIKQVASSQKVTHGLPNAPEPNERQARELAKLPAAKQAEAWKAVVEVAPQKNGKPQVTGQLVKSVVRKINDQKPSGKQERPRLKLLKKGELSEWVAEAINNKTKFNEILSHIAKAKALAKVLCESPLGAHINWNRLDIDLKNVRGNIRIAMPYGPCPYCGQDGCKACNKQGWLTKMKIDAAGEQWHETTTLSAGCNR